MKRRSLSNVGGSSELRGDPEAARKLARCFSVRPAERLPFTHGFHPWPARLHPDIAERLIEAFPGGPVVDPFVGSGTVAVEALRAGRPFIGTDLSPIAIEVAWIRTRLLPPARCREIEAAGAAAADRASRDPARPLPVWAEGERDWYDPNPLREVVALRASIELVEDGILRRLLMGALSALTVRLSKQVSDSVTKVDPTRGPLPVGVSFKLFRAKCAELTQGLLLLSSDLHKRKVKAIEPDLRIADARTIELPPNSVRLVATSPPYPGVYDYAGHHARRMALYKFPAEAGKEIGSRDAVHAEDDGLARYRADMTAVLARLAPALDPQGRIALVIGDGIAGGKAVKADRLVREIAGEAKLRVVASASQERIDWSRGRRGLHKKEHLMLLARQ